MKVLFLLFLFIGGCRQSVKPVDVSGIDQLLATGKLKQASREINKQLNNFELDSLQIKKLLHRRMLVEKEQLFAPIKKKLFSKDTNGVRHSLSLSQNYISKYDTLKRRWFWHDYFFLLAQYSAIKKDSARWLSTGTRCLSYPSQEHKSEMKMMEDFAFYHARHKKYNKARYWLDRIVRSLVRKTVKGRFDDVSQYYFDGKFNLAFRELVNTPDSVKTVHWRRIQEFFKLYADSLTMDNRYRLW